MKTIFCLLVISYVMPLFAYASEKEIIGGFEKARIFPGGYQLSAKIDTGADHSSLNVTDFTPFRRETADWVRFIVVDDNGKEHKLEKKLLRLTRIKRHSAPRQERPVVLLGICVGSHYREAEVNLVDRGQFKFPLLIGRSFLSGAFIVDPSKSYSVEPACPGGPVE
jgi:hypothetical protein